MNEAENTDAKGDSNTQRDPVIYSMTFRTLMDMFDEGAFEEVLQRIQDLDTYDSTKVGELSPKLAEVLLGIREQLASFPEEIEQSVASNQTDALKECMDKLHWNMNQTRILIELVTLKHKSIEGLSVNDNNVLASLNDGRELRDSLFEAQMEIGEGIFDERRWGAVIEIKKDNSVIVDWHGDDFKKETLVSQVAKELDGFKVGDEFEVTALVRDTGDEQKCIALADCKKISIQVEQEKIRKWYNSLSTTNDLPTGSWNDI